MKEHSLIRIVIATATAMLASTPALAADVTNCGTTYQNLLSGSDTLHADLKFEPTRGSTTAFRLYGNKIGKFTCDDDKNLKSIEISAEDTSHSTFQDIDEFNKSVVIVLFAAGLKAKDAVEAATPLQAGAHHASLEDVKDGGFTMPLGNLCKATLRIWLPHRYVSIVCG